LNEGEGEREERRKMYMCVGEKERRHTNKRREETTRNEI